FLKEASSESGSCRPVARRLAAMSGSRRAATGSWRAGSGGGPLQRRMARRRSGSGGGVSRGGVWVVGRATGGAGWSCGPPGAGGGAGGQRGGAAREGVGEGLEGCGGGGGRGGGVGGGAAVGVGEVELQATGGGGVGRGEEAQGLFLDAEGFAVGQDDRGPGGGVIEDGVEEEIGRAHV